MPFEAQAHDIQLTLNTSSEMVIVRSTSTSCHLLHLLTHFVNRLKADYALVGFLSLTGIGFPIQATVKSPLKKNSTISQYSVLLPPPSSLWILVVTS